MKVVFSPRAKKQLKSLSRTAQIILAKKIGELTVRIANEEKLSGYQDIYRIRIGNYRLVYKRSRQQIFLILIGHRKEIYRLLHELLG